MNSYSIFAIVLTVAYLIYYAVIVAHDLYGKKKMCKTSEEVFDLASRRKKKASPYRTAKPASASVRINTKRRARQRRRPKHRVARRKHPTRRKRSSSG